METREILVLENLSCTYLHQGCRNSPDRSGLGLASIFQINKAEAKVVTTLKASLENVVKKCRKDTKLQVVTKLNVTKSRLHCT